MRKRGNMKLHKFNLDRDDPHQKQLSEYLVNLSYHGKASEWIIATLIASVPTGIPQVPKKDTAGTRNVPKVTIGHKGTEHTDVMKVKVEKLQSQGSHPISSNLTPTEIIRQRKAEAKAKFATPASKPKDGQ